MLSLNYSEQSLFSKNLFIQYSLHFFHYTEALHNKQSYETPETLLPIVKFLDPIF